MQAQENAPYRRWIYFVGIYSSDDPRITQLTADSVPTCRIVYDNISNLVYAL